MEVLGMCLPYIKRYFPEHQWSAFVYGWNDSDSSVFGNAGFGEVKDHSLRTTPLKKMAMEILGMYSPYVKRYFQENQLSVFSLWLK